MKKIILAIGAISLAFCSCTKVLYTHYDYDEAVYFYAKNSGNIESKHAKKLLKSYKNIVDNPKGENMVAPPGTYADYAYLLFKDGKIDQAKMYFQKEYVTYPESKPYVESLMQKLGL